MRIQEVIRRIGINQLQEFYRFMEGQTVGMYPNGDVDYYKCDVENFLRPESKRFFD